jgi:hypothetical protein
MMNRKGFGGKQCNGIFTVQGLNCGYDGFPQKQNISD